MQTSSREREPGSVEADVALQPVATREGGEALRRRVAAILERQSRYTLLLGESPAMLEVRDLIERVADTDVTVLVRGESGTGKELVARAIHAASSRRARPFVKVNCAALPAELLESELFGFERGAFTGAIQQKPGKFEFANHGTMFLDEISELPPALQAKLLHVLQDGEFSRLGGRQDLRVDVRVLAATNRDLEGAVADGQFREDLFFRINVVCITLPPLRQRLDELPFLTEYFLQKYTRHYNKQPFAPEPETLRLFERYWWPGNIRELENLVKRMVILGSDAPIREEIARALAAGPVPRAAPVIAAPVPVAPLPAAPSAPVPAPPEEAPPGPCSLKEIARNAAREAERRLIARTLQHTRWNRREAAAILGISYKALLYKIKEAELDRAS
ncbi:MAG TPA: sigma 54-interacting transcriptional regulator [Vicinamibacterales bacterium]|nr:sigma 54-interacting transcriptional regulator [Vicinamibacterales bacterium]